MKGPFELTANEGYHLIRINRFQDADGAKAFGQQIDQMTDGKSLHAIIDCEGLSEIIGPWIRVFMQLHRKLSDIEKQIRVINASEALVRNLKTEGVAGSLKISANLKAAMVDLGLVQQKSLDVNFINPFLKAAVKVLETQSSTSAKAGQVYKKGPRDRFMGDISGVIGLVSEAFTGSVVISFPSATFLKIMSRMLGEELSEVTKEIEDGAGELTNIIFGQAKIELNERGYGIKTALPSVVTGQDHSIMQMTNGPRVVIPFETDVGPFFVEICLST
ncbi:MAG: hypothetical protein HC902_05535 [Calothrix sp. SM1_5_4]|nr:hypothetical protein [Calothrix sp. SM1_5_4]